MKCPPVLILPGLGSSGPEHWQTLWERANPAFSRVEQHDWDKPDREDWIAAPDRAIATQAPPPLLVAHSLSCALVAHWAARHKRPLHGAMLVAPADVDAGTRTPPEVRGFAPMPLMPIPGRTIVVASADRSLRGAVARESICSGVARAVRRCRRPRPY